MHDHGHDTRDYMIVAVSEPGGTDIAEVLVEKIAGRCQAIIEARRLAIEADRNVAVTYTIYVDPKKGLPALIPRGYGVFWIRAGARRFPSRDERFWWEIEREASREAFANRLDDARTMLLHLQVSAYVADNLGFPAVIGMDNQTVYRDLGRRSANAETAESDGLSDAESDDGDSANAETPAADDWGAPARSTP